jgi:hypothetical protein
MTQSAAKWLAWSLFLLAAVATGGAIVLTLVDADVPGAQALESTVIAVVDPLAFLLFPAAGALIAARRPHNPVGWLLLMAGLVSQLGEMSRPYGFHALVADTGSLPWGGLASWFFQTAWIVPICALPPLFLLFPTGRLVARGWRWLLYASGLPLVAFVALGTVAWPYRGRTMLLAVEDIEELKTADGFIVGGLLVYFVLLAFSVISLIVRFRRARGDERQQLKWLCVAGAILVAQGIGDTVVFVDAGDVSQLVSTAIFALVPVAIGIAMLRYRLYDIDLIINRTLVYGALTALLAAAYFGVVVALQNAIPGADDSDLTIAGSTLAVAALFRPLRARVQAFIDRRFDRRKFDAQRTLESFSSRLREDVDIDHLSADLLRVVHDTMQPVHASLWIRTTESGS